MGVDELDALYFHGSVREVAKAVAAFTTAYDLTRREMYEKVLGDFRNGEIPDINRDLYEAYSRNFRKAVNDVLQSGSRGDPYFDMQMQFEANVSRFAAYKAYQATKELSELEPGQLDTVGRAKLNKYNRWQATEYNTAMARARTARQFTDFTSDPKAKLLYPNLKWLPSRSAHPREAHHDFWNKVWAKDDPFWDENTPGSLWNCKCDWRETDEPVTSGNPGGNVSQKGLTGNPSKTGNIFSENNAYEVKSGKVILDSETVTHYPAMQKLLDTNIKEWRLDYYSDEGGLLSTNRKRINESKLNKQEKTKFDKERDMCLTLARNNHIIEYRESIEGSFDVYIDGKPADLKKTKGISNIYKYAHHAVNKQGADYVIFEFDMKNNEDLQKELYGLKKENIKVYYFFTEDKSRIYQL